MQKKAKKNCKYAKKSNKNLRKWKKRSTFAG